MSDTAASSRFGERVIALAVATIETARPARCDGHHENAVLAANRTVGRPSFGSLDLDLDLVMISAHLRFSAAMKALAWRRTMTMAILASVLFFVAVPSVVAGLIPWWMTRWEFLPPFFDLQATRAVGILLIVAGLPGLVDSFARFALQGLGTPAPIAPTQNLVVTGLYRYVRNPMYVAVVAVIVGQAILFGDWRLMTYGGLVWLAFHAFVLTYEEPVLAQRFGAKYEDFRANVPRWIPRLSPWRAA